MTEREMARKKAAARKARARKQRTRRAVMTIALMLVVSVASIGGTIAWLTDKTGTVENTFTPSTIGIDLNETEATDENKDGNYEWSKKMVPGNEIPKNPTVTIDAGSEASWVFVEVTESSNLSDFITYSVITDDNELVGTNNRKWTMLNASTDSTTGAKTTVYYCMVEDLSAAGASDVSIPVIGYANGTTFVQDKVLVNTAVTKTDMDNLTEATYPTLTFKAYAIQQANVGVDTTKTEAENALDAWTQAKS